LRPNRTETNTTHSNMSSSLKKRKLNGNAPPTSSAVPKVRPSKSIAPPVKASKPTSKPVTKSAPPKQSAEAESSDDEAEDEEDGEDEEVVAATEENQELEGDEVEVVAQKSFADLGIIESLCEACVNLGYKHPTPIQEQSIPLALEGKDM
jgi:ATP-dependent RNA helicase DDX47/RRP3